MVTNIKPLWSVNLHSIMFCALTFSELSEEQNHTIIVFVKVAHAR